MRANKLHINATAVDGRIPGDLNLSLTDNHDQLTVMVYKDYAVAQSKIADVMLNTGETSNALDGYLASERILIKLIEMEFDYAPVLSELGLLHRKKSDVYMGFRKFTLAEAELLEAIKTAESVLSIKYNEEYVWDSMVYSFQLGEVYRALNQRAKARHSYKHALDISEELSHTPRIVMLQRMCQKRIMRCVLLF